MQRFCEEERTGFTLWFLETTGNHRSYGWLSRWQYLRLLDDFGVPWGTASPQIAGFEVGSSASGFLVSIRWRCKAGNIQASYTWKRAFSTFLEQSDLGDGWNRGCEEFRSSLEAYHNICSGCRHENDNKEERCSCFILVAFVCVIKAVRPGYQSVPSAPTHTHEAVAAAGHPPGI